MQPMLAKTLLHPSTSGKLIPEVPIVFKAGRTFCLLQVVEPYYELRTPEDSLRILLTKELPVLNKVTRWSKHYYNQSSEVCQNYYKENVMVTLDKALSICHKSVRQSCLEWATERQKRITGSTCFQLYKYCKSGNPNWEQKLTFAYKAKDFPLYLTQATTHGLSHQKAAQRKYCERIKESRVLDLGLVVHPRIPFLGFSPDGVVIDRHGKPQGLIEIKCPLDGRCISSEDLLKLAMYVNENGTIRSDYKYYGQVQLGMFILGLPYCDFLMYSSSENDYARQRIKFDELFIEEMMASLVRMYFEEMLPRLTKRYSDVHKRCR